MPSKFTQAREAVCNAIELKPELQQVFQSKYYLTKPSVNKSLMPPDKQILPTSLAQLPAIRVRPAAGRFQMRDNTFTSAIPYTIEVSIWFPLDKIDEAEAAFENILAAVWKQRMPGETGPHGAVRAVACEQISIERMLVTEVRLGEVALPNAIQFTFGVTIPVKLQLGS